MLAGSEPCETSESLGWKNTFLIQKRNRNIINKTKISLIPLLTIITDLTLRRRKHEMILIFGQLSYNLQVTDIFPVLKDQI